MAPKLWISIFFLLPCPWSAGKKLLLQKNKVQKIIAMLSYWMARKLTKEGNHSVFPRLKKIWSDASIWSLFWGLTEEPLCCETAKPWNKIERVLSRDTGLFPFFLKGDKVSLNKPMKPQPLSRGTVPKLTPHTDLLVESSKHTWNSSFGWSIWWEKKANRCILGFFCCCCCCCFLSFSPRRSEHRVRSGAALSQLTGIQCLAQGHLGMGDASQDAALSFQTAKWRQLVGWLVGWLVLGNAWLKTETGSLN